MKETDFYTAENFIRALQAAGYKDGWRHSLYLADENEYQMIEAVPAGAKSLNDAVVGRTDRIRNEYPGCSFYRKVEIAKDGEVFVRHVSDEQPVPDNAKVDYVMKNETVNSYKVDPETADKIDWSDTGDTSTVTHYKVLDYGDFEFPQFVKEEQEAPCADESVQPEEVTPIDKEHNYVKLVGKAYGSEFEIIPGAPTGEVMVDDFFIACLNAYQLAGYVNRIRIEVFGPRNTPCSVIEYDKDTLGMTVHNTRTGRDKELFDLFTSLRNEYDAD